MVRKIAVLAGALLLSCGWMLLTLGGVLPRDLLFQKGLSLRGPETSNSPVVFVGIDGSALDAVGAWPWSSSKMQELVGKLADWGAKTVVLDGSLFGNGGLSDPGADPSWGALGARLPLILPLKVVAGGAVAPCLEVEKIEGMPLLDNVAGPASGGCYAGLRWGVDSLEAIEGRLSQPLLWNVRALGGVIPSQAVAAMLVAQPPEKGRAWWDGATRSIQGGRGPVGVDEQGAMLINLYGGPGALSHASAGDVLKGQVEGSYFRDRVVVIGISAVGVAQSRLVPFNTPVVGNRMPLAELRATVVSNLLDGSAYRVSSTFLGLNFLLWILVCIATFLGLRLRPAWVGWVILGGFMVACVAGTGVAFGQMRVWIDPVPAFLYPLCGMMVLALWPRVPRVVPAAVREVSTLTRLRNIPDDPAKRGVGAPVNTASQAVAVIEGGKSEGDRLIRDANGNFLQIGRYVNLKLLASGGMSRIYEGMDPVMDRRVAIKILRSDKNKGEVTSQRFLREAKVAGSLNHPNINTVFDFGQAEDILFLVLEFIEGQTLSQWIKEHNGVRPVAILPWVRQIADALDVAHQSQIVHRDVKPSNFMIVNSTDTIKLMDFGVARTPDVTLTQVGTTVGTPNYMAPEQLQGSKVGPASDQYSLGVVVYQMLTQRLPFHGEGLTQLCGNILKGNGVRLTTLRPDLPKALCDVVHRAFALRAEDRFGSCTEFAEAFARSIPK